MPIKRPTGELNRPFPAFQNMLFSRAVCRSTGQELGHVTTEGKVMPSLAVVAIVVGRSLRIPHVSIQNRTESRNSLKRKHMIRSRLPETLVAALGTVDRVFVFSNLEIGHLSFDRRPLSRIRAELGIGKPAR
jgi:hypothetical protein